MQSLHRLLDRRMVVESMDLEQVHILNVHALEGGIDGVEDGCSAEAAFVHVVFRLCDFLTPHHSSHVWCLAYVAEAFAEDDQFSAFEVVLLYGFADDFFRDAVGIDLGIC